MKKLLLIPILLTILGCACQVGTNSPKAISDILALLKKNDYKTLYEKHISIEMKAHITKSVYNQIQTINQDLIGDFISSEFKSETPGKYRSLPTRIYNYTATYSKTEAPVDLSIEMLNGYVLRLHSRPSKWLTEPQFIHDVTLSAKEAIKKEDFKSLYDQLTPALKKKYTEESYTNAITLIVDRVKGQNGILESVDIDSDNSGRMIVDFNYNVGTEWLLTLRYHYQNSNYVQAGMFLAEQ